MPNASTSRCRMALLAAALLLGARAPARADLGAGLGAPAPCFYPDAEADADFVPLNNIFNPNHGEKATFRYVLPGASHVTLRIYTRTGTLVATLVDEDRPAGTSSIDWRGVNSNGDTVASGVYLVRIQAEGLSRVQKVVVVK